MPYSMDNSANRDNPISPAPSSFTFQDQMIYRLASLEGTLNASLRRIDEKIDRWQADAHNRLTEQAANAASLEARLEAIKDSALADRTNIRKEVHANLENASTRIANLEAWKRDMIVRGSLIAGSVSVAWVLFGAVITDFFNRITGVQ